MPGVRTRFVRFLVEAFERDARREVLDEAYRRIDTRLTSPDVRAQLPATGHADSLDLADAEELLIGLDAACADGSGQLLERYATELFAHLLGQGTFSVTGDLMATVARMQAPIEHMFVGLPMGFDLSKKRDGFVLFLGVQGRPRTARLLRHLAVGAVRAAQRFAREGMTEEVVLTTESLGERVRIEAHLGAAPVSQKGGAGTPARPANRASVGLRKHSKPHLPTTKPTLEAVDRILRRASITPPPPPDEIVAPRSKRPRIEAPEVSAAPRTDTLRSISQSGFVTRSDDDDDDAPSSSSG